jgi:hypothetical protein
VAGPPWSFRSPASREEVSTDAIVQAWDWAALRTELDAFGGAPTPPVLQASQCRALRMLYDEVTPFRTTVDLSRYRFGSGQYRSFANPLPHLVEQLRAAFYPPLVRIAREWATRRGRPTPWPDTLTEWLDMCHRAGQTKPTPTLLRYLEGDWNALHQDLYGDLVFPLQVVIGLDEPGVDYSGGEFLLVEQRPRAQSRATAWMLGQGHGLIFTTRDRPVPSARGWSTAPVRHGVSTIRSGARHTLGLVLHDGR